MICELDQNGFCARHRTIHAGVMLRLALDPSELGERHRQRWDELLRTGRPTATPVTTAQSSWPCIHLGAATGRTVECGKCPLDHRTAAVHDCPIRGECAPSLARHHQVTGCGNCSDREAPTPAAPTIGKKALVTLNIGNVLASKSRDSMRDAARRWGADFHEITAPLQKVGGRPHWQKTFLAQWATARGYERCVYYDADILIRSDCPSVFDLTPRGHVGIVTNDQIDGVIWRPAPANRYFSSLQTWAKRLNMRVPPLHEHANSGMIVFEPAAHRKLFDAWQAAGQSAKWGAPTRLIDQAAFSVLVHNLHTDADRTWLPMMFNTLIYRHELIRASGLMQTFVYHYTGHRKSAIETTEWRVEARKPEDRNPPRARRGQVKRTPSPRLLGHDVDLANLFERAVCINLDRRDDRWKKFQAGLPQPWPFAPVQRARAIDVKRCNAPKWFRHEVGQWGCLRSHLRAIEDALNDGVKSLLVFEDDAQFCKDFVAHARNFLAGVPDDWRLLFFGGEHTRGKRTAIGPYVEIPGYVTLAHAYVLRGAALEQFYRFASEHTPHRAEIDHRLGEFAETTTLPVYAPRTWIVGQSAGFSDLRLQHRPLRGLTRR